MKDPVIVNWVRTICGTQTGATLREALESPVYKQHSVVKAAARIVHAHQVLGPVVGALHTFLFNTVVPPYLPFHFLLFQLPEVNHNKKKYIK